MIIGVIGNGKLGKALLKHSADYRLLECDLLNEQTIDNAVLAVRPDIIVNCAAKTNVTWCEENNVGAYAVNTFGVERLFSRFSNKIVHVSCDEVYGGLCGPYPEDSNEFMPLNTYAASKYFGDVAVDRVFGVNRLLVRTSKLFDLDTPLVATILDRMKDERPVFGSDELLRNYTYIPHLAQMVDTAIRDNLTGKLNLCSQEVISEAKFVESVCMQFGYDLFYKLNRSMDGASYRKPVKCGLVVEKANRLGIRKYSYLDGLVEMKGIRDAK